MRKLASIKTINNIQPIENADRIELASVGGWGVVVAKNVNHSVGDKKILCSHIDLEYVPVIDSNISLSISSPSDIKKLIELADGKSQLNENTNREGLVYQSLDGSKKFKTISNSFLT